MEKIVLPQIVAMGIYNAQIALKNRTVSQNRKTTMFEIELPIGNGGMSFIDDEVHPIQANTVICAKPGQIRHTRLPFECYYIHAIVNDGQVYDTLTNLSNFIELPNPERIREIFATMCERYEEGVRENELLLQGLMLELVYLLQKYSLGAKQTKGLKNNRIVIEKTIEYIHQNLSAELSLELLAGQANFTPSYFHKLFKVSVGMPLREYIEDQRIKRSIQLMTSTDMTLTQISYECGFSSQSYFSYAFKRKMGLPPREYIGWILKKYEE